MNKLFLGPLYLSLAASIWGGMYVSSKYLLGFIPPFTLLFLRYVLASVILIMAAWLNKDMMKPIRHWGLFLQIGIIGYFLSIGSQFIGTKLANAHIASLITTLSPVFLSIFAIFILKESMTRIQLISFIIAASGVVLIIGLPSGEEHQSTIGILILLFTSLSWGYYSVIARKASSYYSPLQLTTVGIVIATLFTFPVALFERRDWDAAMWFDPLIVLNLLFVGVIATAFAFFSWNKGLELTPSHQAGIFFFLQPVVGSLLGWMLLKEQLSLSFILGSLVMIIGVYLNMHSAPHPSVNNQHKKGINTVNSE